jgi:RES domain-containing protein
MRVFRIEREKFLSDTLKGIGASLSEGFRWNSVNTKLVYTSESRSLAMLEVAVHLDLILDLPTDRYYVEIDIPDDIQLLEIDIEELPLNWDSKPPISVTQFIGDDFVLNNQSAVLKVPSSIVPFEFNYLINPTHKAVEKIKVVSTTPINFDERLKQSGLKK